MTTLKPCPFCGGDVYLSTLENMYNQKMGYTIRLWKIECFNPICGADVPAQLTRELVVERWNTRVSLNPDAFGRKLSEVKNTPCLICNPSQRFSLSDTTGAICPQCSNIYPKWVNGNTNHET
jgi:hypothetical protein